MAEYKSHIEVLLGKRYVRHILFWISYILTMTYIHGLSIQEGKYLPWLLNYLVELPVLVGLTYLVTYVLIPEFFLDKKYVLSVILIILSFLLFSLLNVLLDIFIIEPYFMGEASSAIAFGFTRILNNAFGLAFPVVIFVSATFLNFNARQSGKEIISARVRLQSELEMIRNQMHPVFLRDALDDIYIMSEERSPQLPEMILKISDILHYFLYECNVNMLPLRKEEQSIRTFLGFEKLRYGENFQFQISIKGDLENTMITPYILFPLVRGACRFNDSFDEQPGMIRVKMEIEEKEFKFSVNQDIKSDSYQSNIDFDWKNEVLIARKRLEFIYPWKYKLDVLETERSLLINLSIVLSETLKPET